MYIYFFLRTGSPAGGPVRYQRLHQVCFKSKQKNRFKTQVYASVTAAVSFLCSVMVKYMKA
jgi:hypothetical protein